MVPKLIHFVFGVDKQFCGKPLAFFHYLAVKSFKDIHPDYEIRFHVGYEPSGEIWELIKKHVTIITINEQDIPTEIYGKKIIYPEHKGDILRLDILNEEGGIYADIDTICVKRFDSLISNSFVMGKEMHDGSVSGLCNALMISEINSEFGRIWKETYSEFNPSDWNQMSVRTPYRLARMYSDIIKVEPFTSFFKFSWDGNGDTQMYKKISSVEDCFSIHLWESKSYNFLSEITRESILTQDTTYNILARRHL